MEEKTRERTREPTVWAMLTAEPSGVEAMVEALVGVGGGLEWRRPPSNNSRSPEEAM